MKNIAKKMVLSVAGIALSVSFMSAQAMEGKDSNWYHKKFEKGHFIEAIKRSKHIRKRFKRRHAVDATIEKCEEGFTTLKCAGAESGTRIGAAMNYFAFINDMTYGEVLAEQFNYMTPENMTKWGQMSSEPFRYNFERADELVDFALDNDMQIKGHALLWHNELPPYFNDDLRPGLAKLMAVHHILRVARRYRGKMYSWDVVNEAINDTDGGLRDSVLLRKLGDDYIAKAFYLARKADRHAKLYYNDYSIARINTKSNAVYDLVSGLVARGVPIDGVGFQMHFDANTAPSTEELFENFQRFIDLGLTVNISELDVRVANVFGSQERKLRVQKDIYQRVAFVCQSLPECDGLTSWGFTDQYSWIDTFFGEDDPLQFDEEYQPKPAFFGQFDGLLGIEPVNPDLGDNIVPNPSFESGTDFWFSFGADVQTTSDPVRTGSAAGFITARTGTFQGAVVNLTDSVIPGATYQAKGYARIAGAESDTATLTAKIACEGQDDQFIGIGSGAVNNLDWTAISGSVTIPACTLNEFLFYMEGPQAGVDLLVEDMELRQEEAGFGDNILQNSSFEDGTAPWFPFAGVFETTTEFATSGTSSASLTERFDTWNAIAYNVTDIVTGGAGYSVSVNARIGGAASDNLIITVKTVCEGEADVFTPVASTTVNDADWTSLSGTLVAPSCNLTEMLVYVEGPGAGVDLFVDDFEMRTAL